MLTQIADRLKLPPADAAGLVARLQAPLTLLHVENVDTDEADIAAVGALALRLRGCPLVASARISTLAGSGWWREVTHCPSDGITIVWPKLRLKLRKSRVTGGYVVYDPKGTFRFPYKGEVGLSAVEEFSELLAA